MQAGNLRHRITIQQRSTSEDALGQQVLAWTDVATIWCRVEQLSGRELMTASAERAENTARITVRYRADLVEKMRILYGATIYDITSVSDIEGRRRELEVMVKTGVSNG
jgi:SPP1 family predicted phage head-tail adaptor